MKKSVLITGAAIGLGRQMAIEFAKNGYDIFITYLSNYLMAKDLKEYIEKEYKVKCYIIKCNIKIEDDILNLYNEIKRHINKLDVLINNASLSLDNYYKEKSKVEFLNILDVNVVGTFLVTKYITDMMDNGVIINISSLDSTRTYRDIAMDYCASKAAINSLCQTFSLAIPNNKFLSIMLPWVNTESVREMFDEYLLEELKRANQEKLIEPEDVAKKIYKIISEENYESGSIIDYDEV